MKGLTGLQEGALLCEVPLLITVKDYQNVSEYSVGGWFNDKAVNLGT